MLIEDFENIPEADYPLIAFSDKTSGLIEFLIKFRTKGAYNHVMFLHRPGYFASQGNTYSEAPLSRYMKKGNRIKLVQIVGLSPVQRKLIIESINKKLKLPGFMKLYNWLGIAGQATGLKWLSFPGLEYCSQDVPQHIKYMAIKSMDDEDVRKQVIRNIPKNPSPQELNEYFKNKPEHFKTYGKWEEDDELSEEDLP